MTKYTQSTLPRRFAIVGGGPAGLVTARAFMKRGVEFDIIERHDALGGIWNIEQPGSPMYYSCNFISSRDFGGFIGFDMPSDYPMYPKWNQIRDYVHGFAEAYDLNRHVRLRTEVVAAQPVDAEAGRYWRLTFGDGSTEDYRGVVIATGAQWEPSIPRIPGLETFTGRYLHSAEYKRTDEFVGKRVLVVGAGNSGVDIAADAAFHGDAAYLSTRRGYWFLPKFLYGLPVPDLLAGNVVPEEGSPLHGLSQEEIFQNVLGTLGDLKKFGLPQPDHQLGASHPIINNQVLHCLAHGMLAHKPDLTRISGSTVEFADGSEAEIDVIVFATGYDAHVPWLPEGLIDYEDGHPSAVLGSLFPEQAGLYVAGSLHFAGNTFSIFDRTVQVVAADAEAAVTGEGIESMARLKAGFRPDLKGDFPFLETRRNANQVHLPALEEAFEALEREYGIAVPSFGDQEFYAGVGRN